MTNFRFLTFAFSLIPTETVFAAAVASEAEGSLFAFAIRTHADISLVCDGRTANQ